MREWIVTNGLGGYASLTYSNLNTRKFHGLLVASLNPPTERWVFVSNVYDKIKDKDRFYDLKEYKSSFVFEMFPSFSYEIKDVKIKKTVFMPYEKNTTIVKYEVKTDKPTTFVHSPVINSRHFYDVTQLDSIQFNQEVFENGVSIRTSNNDKTMKIILLDSTYRQAEYWKEYRYEKDHERNDSWIDYNVHIGDFYKTIRGTTEYFLIFTLEDEFDIDPSLIYQQEVQRKKNILSHSNLPPKFKKLVLSADNFIVKKGNSKSVIAGYHWFGDWGRDTLISLPGLTLVTKRFDAAKQILLG